MAGSEGLADGILSRVRKAEGGRVDGSITIDEPAVDLLDEHRVRFGEYIKPEAGDVDITQQRVLISVGRGIETQDNISMAEDRAFAFGGAVCASRLVIDQGWLPLSRQAEGLPGRALQGRGHHQG